MSVGLNDGSAKDLQSATNSLHALFALLSHDKMAPFLSFLISNFHFHFLFLVLDQPPGMLSSMFEGVFLECKNSSWAIVNHE